MVKLGFTRLNVIFHISVNIDCGYSLEPPRQAQGELLWLRCVRRTCVVRRSSSVVNIYHVHFLEATVLFQSSWNFTRMFVLVISRSSSNIGHVWSKTRSLGQISLKPCSPSRGHSFASIIMKLYQIVCLDDISIRFECGSCRAKT